MMKNAHFYVFSDDIKWAKENLTSASEGSQLTFFEGESPEADLWLMSQAMYHIIANISLSWWGAWLASSGNEHVVICPSPWFDASHLDTTDLIPEAWIQIAKNPSQS
jgi:hypothetical protein